MDPGDIAVTSEEPGYRERLYFHLQYIGEAESVCFRPPDDRMRERKAEGAPLYITEVTLLPAVGAASTDFVNEAEFALLNVGSDVKRRVRRITRGELEKLRLGNWLDAAADWYVLLEEKTIRIFSGDYEVRNRGEEFSFYLYNIISKTPIGKTEFVVQVELEDGEENTTRRYTIPLQKIVKAPRIVKFYPEKGAAYLGESVKLHWRVENAARATLLLPDGTQKTIDTLRQDFEAVQVKQTASYTLRVQNTRQTVRIETAPLFLEKFFVDYANQKVIWRAECAKNQKVTVAGRVYDACGSIDASSLQGNTVLLEGEGAGLKIRSTLYRDDNKSKAIVHFHKTILYYDTYQILRVEWNTKGLETAKLFYQDYERGEVVEMMTEGASGTWEQLVFGDCVKITLEAREFAQDASFRITI